MTRVTFIGRALLAGSALSGVAAAMLPTQVNAQVEATRAFNIPAGDLSDGLNLFGVQSGVSISIDAALARGKRAAAVHGHFSNEEALRRLLAPSGLTFRVGGEGGLIIEQRSRAPSQVTPVSARDPQNTGLEDIVVSARRQTERGQTAPVAVTAISADKIATLNILRLDGISKLAPSVRITEASGSGNAPALFIRGIGTTTTALYAEPAVGLYVDGAYMPRPTGNTFDLPDLAGVEVLRGPQGTLFGRNTTGGAILLTTSTPTEKPGLKADASYGSNNEFTASTVVQLGQIGNTPFKVKLTGQFHNRDGWVDTPGFSKSAWGGALRAYSFGAAIAGEIAPGLTIDNRARYNNVRSYTGWETVGGSALGQAWFGNGVTLGGPPVIFDPSTSNPTDLQYRDPRSDSKSVVKAWGDTFTLQYVASPAITLKSIVAVSQINESLHANLGGASTLGTILNPVNPAQPVEPISGLTTVGNPGHQRQFSFEQQASGTIGDFHYVVGGFIYRERVAESIGAIINAPVSATQGIRLNELIDYGILSHSYAGFGEVGWKPGFANDKLELTGGLRYTDDRKTLSSSNTVTIFAPAIVAQTAKNSWHNLGWSASASYKLTPGIFTYFKASSAYRAGGYNAPSVGAPAFNPEKARSYEFGVKSDLFDRHLRINGDVFQTDYSDLQVGQFNTVTLTNVITNAGKARYRGAELETELRFGPIRADANVGYIDPKYQQYIFIVNGIPTNVASTAHFALVSRWTWHVGAQYDFHLPDDGTVSFRVDYDGKSSPFTYVVPASSPNFAQFPKLGRDEDLSLRLIWNGEWASHKVHAQAFVENLTDHRDAVFASDLSTIFAATYNRPRYFGVAWGFDF